MTWLHLLQLLCALSRVCAVLLQDRFAALLRCCALIGWAFLLFALHTHKFLNIFCQPWVCGLPFAQHLYGDALVRRFQNCIIDALRSCVRVTCLEKRPIHVVELLSHSLPVSFVIHPNLSRRCNLFTHFEIQVGHDNFVISNCRSCFCDDPGYV